MQRSSVLLLVAGVLLAAVALVYGWPRLFPGTTKRTPEELAKIALTADTAAVREAAAVELIPRGEPAVAVMRRVLDQSDKPEVRSAMIQGLSAVWDIDCMPLFFAAMDDDALAVRTSAAAAVRKVLLNVGSYREDDPPEMRKAEIEECREDWAKLRKSNNFEQRWQQAKHGGS
jgi:hypothetical protein